MLSRLEASADGPVRQAAAASQRLGASSARTAAVGGVRLTELTRPRKAPLLPRPRAKPAWDPRQTAITPTPREMLPTEAEVARAHRHELQRQQQMREQLQDWKASQQPVGVLWRTAPARLTAPTAGGFEFYFPEATPREHSTAHSTENLTGSSQARESLQQQPPPTGAFAPFRMQHALPYRTTPGGFVSGFVEPPIAIFGRTRATAASAAEAPYTAPTGYAASGVFTRPLVSSRPGSPTTARGGVRAPSKPKPAIRRAEGTRRAAPALQAARQIGAQNEASGQSGDPRGISSNGFGSRSAVLSTALSSSSLGLSDAQDGAMFPHAGLPSGGSPSPKTAPSPDTSTVDASTATRVLRILLELTAPACGGSLSNFDVSALRLDEAAKLIELAQAKLGVTSWAGNGRRAGGGVGAGRYLGSRSVPTPTPELLVQQVTELERILQMRRPPGVEPPKVEPPTSPRRPGDAQYGARLAWDAKPPLETAFPHLVWAEEGVEGSPPLDGSAELPPMDVLSAESGTLAPLPLQPPLDVPEDGSVLHGSPTGPTKALGTAPMKAFIDAFESEEGKAELRRLLHSIDTDGSGVVSSKEWGKAIGQHWKLMGRFFGGLTVGEVGQMFKKLNADGSGDLTWDEFEIALQQMDWSVRLAQALESQQGAAELKALWDRLDKDADGKVSVKEWGSAVHKDQQVMTKYFGGKDLNGIGKMFSKIDADGSGDLTWDEFVNGSIQLVQPASPELPNMARPSVATPSLSPFQAVLPPEPYASFSPILGNQTAVRVVVGDQPPSPRGHAARARAAELKQLADAKEVQHGEASARAEIAEEAAAEAEAAIWRGGHVDAERYRAAATEARELERMPFAGVEPGQAELAISRLNAAFRCAGLPEEQAVAARNVHRAILKADNSPCQRMEFRSTTDGCALLPPRLHQALSELDAILIQVLMSGAIRLLRVEWLMKQLDNFKMPRRQVLEELEESGVLPSPLLSGEEAAALVLRGDRSIGALTYGWLMSGDPDPKGSRIRVLRRALTSLAIEAVFWDFGSLYQAERTLEQAASFKLALEGGAMNQLYASILATTVLQIEEIPPRPAEFDGVVCLFKLCADVDESAVRAALVGFGTIERCDLSRSPAIAIVRFASHESALAAKDAGVWPGLCEGLDTQYNETPYFSRGWCCCEDSLSRELMKRLTAYPALRVHLDQLQPKVFALSNDADATPVEIKASELDVAVDIERIDKSKFTSKGDKLKVIDLYKEYVHNTVGALQRTLGSLQMASHTATTTPAEPPPQVDAPAASPLRLAKGQPLLLLSPQGSGVGDGPRFGVVDATGGRVTAAVTGEDNAELAYDRCSQAVLPWRPPAAGWDAAFVGDARALRDLAEPARRLADDARRMESESALRAVGERAREIADGAGRCQTIAHAAREAGSALRSCVDVAAALFSQDNPTQLLAALDEVRAAVERLTSHLQTVALEAALTAALRSSGALGARRYAAGQLLTVHTTGGWRDADVATAGANGLCHLLTFEGSGEPPATLTLHPWNHAPRELPHAAYEAMHEWWTRELRVQHSQICDALSGKWLDALQQCVAIKVMGDANLAGVHDVRGLSDWLHLLHAAQSLGEAISAPGAALLTAPPAAGKTTLISQVVVLALDRAELVPIVIKVQLLQARLRDAADVFASHWNWVDAYLCLTYAERPEVYRMLRQAMMARRALLLLDGLDEASAKRAEIEQHVVEVLAPQGHVLLCTSRPAGVVEARFSGFRLLKLAPLTEAQQEQALLQRLGNNEGDVRQLMTFVERMPTSTDPDAPTTQHRVTANPLMLSMVASVFELRKGLGMPETVAELYKSASDAMLERGGGVTAEVRMLLEAVFFEAHVAQARMITDVQLLRAALGAFAPAGTLADLDGKAHIARADAERLRALDGAVQALRDEERAAVAEVRERVQQDRLPLLSLLQVEPFQMQSAHLSFQEYFAARAICSGEYRLPEGSPPPWQWPVFWANAVTLGSEMGDDFGRGLLRAAGVTGDTLDLSQKLTGGDRPTMVSAVTQLMRGLASLSLRWNKLTDGEGVKMFAALQTNTTLTQLDLGGNQLGAESGKAMVEVLKTNTTLRTVALDGAALSIAELTAAASIMHSEKRLGDASGIVIAHLITRNRSLTQLSLNGNKIGNEGAKAIAEALKVSAKLRTLDLIHNNIGPEGAKAIAQALKSGTAVTKLSLYSNYLGAAGENAVRDAVVKVREVAWNKYERYHTTDLEL